MWPLPCSSSAGRNAVTPRITPRRLMSRIQSQSSSGHVGDVAAECHAGVEADRSARPKRAKAASRRPVMPTGRGRRRRRRGRRAVVLERADGLGQRRLRDVAEHHGHAVAAQARANARPMPRAPPVTTATCCMRCHPTAHAHSPGAPRGARGGPRRPVLDVRLAARPARPGRVVAAALPARRRRVLESTAEVSAVLRACNEHGVPVVPFAGGSSLEGQVLPTSGGISLDCNRMARILDIDDRALDARVQPRGSRRTGSTPRCASAACSSRSIPEPTPRSAGWRRAARRGQ